MLPDVCEGWTASGSCDEGTFAATPYINYSPDNDWAFELHYMFSGDMEASDIALAAGGSAVTQAEISTNISGFGVVGEYRLRGLADSDSHVYLRLGYQNLTTTSDVSGSATVQGNTVQYQVKIEESGGYVLGGIGYAVGMVRVGLDISRAFDDDFNSPYSFYAGFEL